MSDSVRPHRRKLTRLPCPWDSPGKNTGVGHHFLLQCVKGKSESEVTQSCPTLSDPMDCSLPGYTIHGIFQARVLEWAAIAFSNIGVQLINNVVIVSVAQQSNSAIHTHVSILPQAPLPSRLPYNIEQGSLCYTVGLLPRKSHGRRSLVGCSP